ncbi:hypothetical protein KR093_005664 [Drosophila rubida]|uniref:Secreted protein n=1 Tax=Drosophila rubida TaxID=30044 RepID=A0AAD4KA57_9MUSC|nr:hypothetical protein KR093_005664 [Drosophila rubida]
MEHITTVWINMKWHILFSLLFVLALVAPLVWTAAVEPLDAVEVAEEVQESASGADDSQDPEADIVAADYIDVADYTRPPHPWWW